MRWLKDRFGVSWQIVPTRAERARRRPGPREVPAGDGGDARDAQARDRRARAGRSGGVTWSGGRPLERHDGGGDLGRAARGDRHRLGRDRQPEVVALADVAARGASHATCSSVSTPSATTSSPRSCASATIDRTIAASRRSVAMPATNERSIFSVWRARSSAARATSSRCRSRRSRSGRRSRRCARGRPPARTLSRIEDVLGHLELERGRLDPVLGRMLDAARRGSPGRRGLAPRRSPRRPRSSPASRHARQLRERLLEDVAGQRRVRPACSIAARNCSGSTRPSVGWRQRTSASAPRIRPSARSNCGW